MFVHHLDLQFLQLELLVTNLQNFLVPKLSSVTFNEFTVKDLFAFAEEIVYSDSKLFIGSLDVDSLFSDIPLEETINICTNLLYSNEDIIEGINKSEFTEDMLMTFLFSSNRLNASRNFMIILILVIQTCLFHFNKKKMESCNFLMQKYLGKKVNL